MTLGPGDDLRQHMQSASQQFAVAAVRDYDTGDWISFALHAGAALELLAKAYLASIHPSLVVDGVDSLLYASNVPGHTRMPLGAIRTIKTSEAIARVSRVLPTISNLTRGDLTILIEVRNGAAHLGRVDEMTARRMIVPFLRACEEILRVLGVETSKYWQGVAMSVGERLSASADSARERVARRLGQAKRDFKERMRGKDQDARQALIESMYATYDARGYERRLGDCPACGNRALLTGSIDSEWTVPDGSMDPDVWENEAYPEVTFYPADLRCHVCGLALNGSDELEAAEFPLDWLIPQEEVDPSDFVPRYEDVDL